jgi:hypothetical protein
MLLDTKPSLTLIPPLDAPTKGERRMQLKQMSFLPEPLYNPKYPPEASLTNKALRLMLTGARVTHPQFEALTGSWRLAGYIHTLKKLEWPVHTEHISIPGNEEGDRNRSIVVYYLPDDLLEFMQGVQKGIVPNKP